MKKFKIVLAVLLCFVMTAASAGSDEISAEKKADIETLLKLTGALRLGKQMSSMFVTKMTQALKENRPDVPPEMYDVLKEEVNNVIEEALPTFAQLIITSIIRLKR